MPLCFAKKNGMVHIHVTGMSADFKEEFFNFRRLNMVNPKGSEEGSEGTKADDYAIKGEFPVLTYQYKAYFSRSAAEKVVAWLQLKGAENKSEEK